MSGNVARLNQQSLGMVPYRQHQLEESIKMMQDRLDMPGYYSAEDAARVKARIDRERRQSAELAAWADKAKKGNFFTGVGSAIDSYAHEGAVHIVNPRRVDVQSGFGPGGEYQIVGKQKPVASFLTGGRPGKQKDEAIRLAQQAGDALAKKQRRQAVIKQTAKNLRPKKR
jgi:predicted transcriptional regulator